MLLKETDADPDNPTEYQSAKPTCSDLAGNFAAITSHANGMGPLKKCPTLADCGDAPVSRNCAAPTVSPSLTPTILSMIVERIEGCEHKDRKYASGQRSLSQARLRAQAREPHDFRSSSSIQTWKRGYLC